jgi:agmatine/peptidylarginine deiminase
MEQLVNLLKEGANYVIVDTKKIKEAYEQVSKSINRLCPVLILEVKNGKLTLKAYPNISSVDIDTIESNDNFSVDLCPFEFKMPCLVIPLPIPL